MNSLNALPAARRWVGSPVAGTRRRTALKWAVLLLILVGAAAGAAPSAGQGAGKPAGETVPWTRLFALVGPDYKKAREIPDLFFNPFKVEATTELSMQKKGAAVSEQSVAEAVGRRGVSGIVYAANAGASRVIIGDQVFRIGDELSFSDGASEAAVPLVPGASVILREVRRDSLVFDFAAEGESARRSTLPLRTFWRP